MSLRLIEIVADVLPADFPDALRIDSVARPDGKTEYRVLARASRTKAILDALEPGAQAVVTIVQTTRPLAKPSYSTIDLSAGWFGEVSVGELSERAIDAASLGPLNLMLVALSSLIAAAGMIGGSVAVVVGGMVIAPIIGPLVATTFGALVRNPKLLRSAVVTSALSVFVALIPALVLGVIVQPDPSLDLLAMRTSVSWWDVLIGASAGAAGAVSFAQDARTALVGVAVAVALVPPIAAVGLCVGSGAWSEALGAAALIGVNVGTIWVASVAVFALLGVRRSALETESGAGGEALLN